jgi:hypothetical protein
MHIRLWAAAAAFGLSLTVAAPAMAEQGECLYLQAPQAARDALMAAATKGLPTGEDFKALVKSIPNTAAVAKACGVDANNGKSAVLALDGYEATAVATRWLETHSLVTGDQLEAGWSGMTPALRDAMVAAVSGDKPARPTKAMLRDFAQHMGSSAVDPTLVHESRLGGMISYYMFGRAIMTANDPKL